MGRCRACEEPAYCWVCRACEELEYCGAFCACVKPACCRACEACRALVCCEVCNAVVCRVFVFPVERDDVTGEPVGERPIAMRCSSCLTLAALVGRCVGFTSSICIIRFPRPVALTALDRRSGAKAQGNGILPGSAPVIIWWSVAPRL